MIRGLYAITDSVLMPSQQFLYKAEACLSGGCRLIQFRDKSNDNHKPQLALQLKELCSRYRATLIINDDVTLAKELEADGVHLGQTDTALSNARKDLQDNFLIGATCHADLQLARDAADAGASYVAFGRFFSSNTKPSAPAAELSVLSQAKSLFNLPVVAIGGITLNNIAQVIQHGADAVAVCNDIFALDQACDIEARVKRYLQLFDENL